MSEDKTRAAGARPIEDNRTTVGRKLSGGSRPIVGKNLTDDKKYAKQAAEKHQLVDNIATGGTRQTLNRI